MQPTILFFDMARSCVHAAEGKMTCREAIFWH